MRILYYLNSSIQKTATGELLDDAQSEICNGNEVAFLICGGILTSCPANRKANPGTCKACMLLQRLNFNLVKGKYKIYRLSDYCKTSDVKWTYNNLEELRSLEYKEIRVGIPMMSSYIEYTRNLYPLVDSESRLYFDTMLTEGAKLIEATESVLNEFNPEKVVLYNGRHLEARPFMDVCMKRGIAVEVMELIETSDVFKFYPVKYYNTLPHSIAANQQVIETVWEKSHLSESEKINIGETFFTNRRNKKRAGDKIYTLQQKEGELPQDWDDSKINISFFNSSEDEYAGLGDEWDNLKLFKDQITGIKNILEHFRDEKQYHFYLRVHPNLKNVKYKYHTDLYELPKVYDNLTVIPAADSVDTYQLMDKSDKIIVFGSTMGIEAAYWNKPVILIGPSIYYFTDLCYIPHTPDDLYSLIESKLEAKRNDFVYKYGFRVMNSIDCSINPNMYNYLDFTGFSMKILGSPVPGMNYQKMFGSKKLYLLVASAVRTFYAKVYKDQLTIPVKDE